MAQKATVSQYDLQYAKPLETETPNHKHVYSRTAWFVTVSTKQKKDMNPQG